LESEVQSNAEVVLSAFRAVEERDVDALFATYHDDVEFHDASSLPYGGTVRGKAAIRAQLEAAPEETWLGTWGPLQPTEAERRMDPRVVAVDGEEVAVLYTQRALSPDGERFEAPVFGLYEVRDSKFARAQMFHYDTASIVAFLARAAGTEPAAAT
jgi:ketosteroid isomerase-like protein